MSAAADRGALLRGSRGRLIAHRRGPPQATYTLISTPLTISLGEPKREEPLSRLRPQPLISPCRVCLHGCAHS